MATIYRRDLNINDIFNKDLYSDEPDEEIDVKEAIRHTYKIKAPIATENLYNS